MTDVLRARSIHSYVSGACSNIPKGVKRLLLSVFQSRHRTGGNHLILATWPKLVSALTDIVPKK